MAFNKHISGIVAAFSTNLMVSAPLVSVKYINEQAVKHSILSKLGDWLNVYLDWLIMWVIPLIIGIADCIARDAVIDSFRHISN